MKQLIFFIFFIISFTNADYLVYEDKKKSANLEFIKQNSQKIFVKRNTSSLGSTSSNIWLKISLKNDSPHKEIKYIQFRENLLFYIEVYDYDNIYIGGTSVPLEKKTIHNIKDTFLIELQENSTKDIYVKAVPKFNGNYGYRIFNSYEEIHTSDKKHNLFASLSYGANLAILFGTLLVLIRFREKLFFYYAIFLTSNLIFQIFKTGHIYYFVQVSDIMKYLSMFGSIFLIFLILFIKRIFDDEFKISRKLNLIFNIFLWVVATLSISFFIWFEQKIGETILFILPLIFAFIFGTLIYFSVKNLKYSFYVLVGYMAYLCAIISVSLQLKGLFELQNNMLYFQIGSFIESLTFFILILNFIYKKLEDYNKKEKEYVSTIEKAQEIAKLSGWKYDIKNENFISFGPIARLHRIKDNTNAKLEEVLNVISPNCLEEFLNKFNFTINNIDEDRTLTYKVIDEKDEIHYIKANWEQIIDESGKVILLEGMSQDITEKILKEEELLKQQEILMHQQKLAQQGEMLHMIGHQWRQPLNQISLYAQLAMYHDKNISDESLERLNIVLKTTDYMSQTINDFKDFFSSEKKLSYFNFIELIDKSLFICSNRVEKHRINVLKDYSLDNHMVLGYESELGQVILAVINNAIDILEELDNDRKINFKVFVENKNINLEICDNAGGIPAKVLPKIFDPYFSTKLDKNGTGLGLYMSKMIIEKSFDGDISAYNKQNGACFKIIIPIKEQVFEEERQIN